MASLSFEKFEKIFKEHQKYQKIKIRYAKQRGNDIIHKDLFIRLDKKNNK